MKCEILETVSVLLRKPVKNISSFLEFPFECWPELQPLIYKRL